jgi:hypothetical protein
MRTIAEILPEEDWAPQESPVVMIPASSPVVYIQATASVERTNGSSSHGTIPSAPPASLVREAHEVARRKLEERRSTLAALKAPTAT